MTSPAESHDKHPSAIHPQMKFKCPHCGNEISVDSTYAGKTGQCWKCNAVLKIPVLGANDVTSPPPMPPVLQAAKPQDEEPAPVSRRRVEVIVCGGIVAVIVLLIVAVNVLSPLTPRQVSERFFDAETAEEAKKYATTNLWPAIDALDQFDDPDLEEERTDFLGEGEAPAEWGGGHIVWIRYYSKEKGQGTVIEGFLHLIELDGWKVEEWYFTSFDNQMLEEPVALSPNYQLIVEELEKEKQASKTPAMLPSISKDEPVFKGQPFDDQKAKEFFRKQGDSKENRSSEPIAKKSDWKSFLKAHWEYIAATDFFTVEVWTLRGLIRYHVLIVMDLSKRRVEVAGICPEPNGMWMMQVARNLTDGIDGFLTGKRFLIHDRDPVFTHEFRELLKSAGIDPVRLRPKSPNLNAFCERFIRSIKEECLDRIIPIGESHLRHAVYEFVDHYHRERNHQGMGNQLLESINLESSNGQIECNERLGGMLKYYHRERKAA